MRVQRMRHAMEAKAQRAIDTIKERYEAQLLELQAEKQTRESTCRVMTDGAMGDGEYAALNMSIMHH